MDRAAQLRVLLIAALIWTPGAVAQGEERSDREVLPLAIVDRVVVLPGDCEPCDASTANAVVSPASERLRTSGLTVLAELSPDTLATSAAVVISIIAPGDSPSDCVVMVEVNQVVLIPRLRESGAVAKTWSRILRCDGTAASRGSAVGAPLGSLLEALRRDMGRAATAAAGQESNVSPVTVPRDLSTVRRILLGQMGTTLDGERLRAHLAEYLAKYGFEVVTEAARADAVLSAAVNTETHASSSHVSSYSGSAAGGTGSMSGGSVGGASTYQEAYVIALLQDRTGNELWRRVCEPSRVEVTLKSKVELRAKQIAKELAEACGIR